MFVSQMSDQKNQSGYKQGSQTPDSITLMTLKMLNKIKLSLDKKDAIFDGIPLTYISILGRKESAEVKDSKGFFMINDDSTQKQFSMQLSGEIDKEIYSVIFNQEDEPRTNYYIFLFKTRVYKEIVIFDIQSIKKVQETAQIIYHLVNLMRIRVPKDQISQPVQQQQHVEKILEEEPVQTSLSDRILNYIRAEVSEKGQISITQTHILNKFADHSGIQDIKKSLSALLANGSLQSGTGINTYILAD